MTFPIGWLIGAIGIWQCSRFDLDSCSSIALGSFVGAYGGGVIYGAKGSYDLAWKGAVAIGIAAGVVQMTMNVRPSARIASERDKAAAAAIARAV